jgi:transitional endoplasmic reticulum ATPase
VDPAVLRSGRFDLVLDLPLPDREARRMIFAIHTRRRTLAPNASPDALAKRSEGLSGADIEAICRRAANLAVSEWMRARGAGNADATPAALKPKQAQPPAIEMRHFDAAFDSLNR